MAGDALEGPQSVGAEQAITHPDSLRLLASLYATALDAGRPVYPYFTAAVAPTA